MSDGEESEVVYKYTVPLVDNRRSKTSEYTTGTPNKTYHTYYGTDSVVVIQDSVAGHLHRDDVRAEVEELDRK